MSDNTYIQTGQSWYKGIYGEDNGGGITLAQADARYVRNGGNGVLSSLTATTVDAGSYLLGGVSVNLNYITGITAGGAQASKAMVLNSELDISGIRNMYANGLTCASSLAAPSLTFDTMNWNGLFVDGASDVSAQNKMMLINSNRDFAGLRFNADNTTTSRYNLNLMPVGTTQPVLNIGDALTNGNSFEIGYTHVGTGNVLNRIFIRPRGATANDTITMTVNSGRVGIGSPTPTQKLEVMGNLNLSNASYYMAGGSNLMSNVPSNNGVRLADNAGLGSEFYTSSTLRYGGFNGVSLGITNVIWTGYGIGETPFIAMSDDFITMGAAMDSDTSIRFIDEDSPTTGFKLSATGVVSTFSDSRLKENIQKMKWDNVLEKIEKLELCKFTFKRPETCERDTGKYDIEHKGFIAQNLLDCGFDDFVSKSEANGMYQVEYGLMYLPLFEAVKELYKRLKKMERRV